MSKLDREEKEILKAFEAGTLKPVRNRRRELVRHRKAAAATFAKDSRINIRISSKDLRALQKRALAEGMPYQTLVASVLHKFVEGQMVGRPASKRSGATRAKARVPQR
jgi:predicted DNA binding CopG/RHH family protein